MDLNSKIYFDFKYDNNKYYDDISLESDLELANDDLIKNLTDTQLILFKNYIKLSNKLQTYKDFHLIDFVIEYITKNNLK